MATAAPRTPSRPRRGGRRFLIVLAVLVLIVAGVLVWLNVAAQAAVDASATLTVYQTNATVAHGSGAANAASTGAVVRAADTVATDAKGLAGITLPDGTLTRLAKGTTVTINAGQQATANPNGSIGPAGPIQPDPNDPFGPALDASNAVSGGTTPGTEQDFIGAPLHNGEQQQFTYSYAGGSLVKASLGYPGSAMKLTVKAPDAQQYTATGKLPVVVIKNAPAGIYTITVNGVSGLGTDGEGP